MLKFSDLGLAAPILDAVTSEGYVHPTPIQAQAIGPVLSGKDVLGCAQTGTGKTAAFALPILQRLMVDRPLAQGAQRHVRALILSPTRELASQIAQSIRTYGKNTSVRYAVVFGGVGQGAQVTALRSGVDVLVATPGRLLDLMNQRLVDLRHVEVFVLDEADRMLDMGFVHDIRRVITQLPTNRQNLMFSATMPADIRKLAQSFLKTPAYIEVTPAASTVDLIEQFVYHVHRDEKVQLLVHLFNNSAVSRMLIFTRTKHGADRLTRRLTAAKIDAAAIHGNKTQGQRQRAMQQFKQGRTPVLVATDIAARGIDIDDISHVINYDIPNEAETYVHRIGRTGRAGASGCAISLCDRSGEEKDYLRDIESLIKKRITVKTDQPQFVRSLETESAHHEDRPGRGDSRRNDRRSQQQAAPAHVASGRGRNARTGPAAHEPARRPVHHPAKPAVPPARHPVAAVATGHSIGRGPFGQNRTAAQPRRQQAVSRRSGR